MTWVYVIGGCVGWVLLVCWAILHRPRDPQQPEQPGLAWLVRRPHTGHVRQAASERCPWCPVTPEEGAREDAVKADCTCEEDCGEAWCARRPWMQEAHPW